MQFTSPLKFEISDEIWNLSGVNQWHPSDRAYLFSAYQDAESNLPHENLPVELIPIRLVVPPQNNGTARSLVNLRMLRILQGFTSGKMLPAVLGQRRGNEPTAYVELVDGAHRFYASVAVGFTHLPVAIRKFYAQ